MASSVVLGQQQSVGKNSNIAASPQLIQEFIVRVPESKNKCYNVMRFNNALKIDVKTWTEAKLERENNIKEFKTDEDLPKYGAGSEFGREQREEARRKKYGIITKKYNPDEQPWVMELGGKGGKKFKGIREGGVTENTSYYVFTKAADGAFEAFPISEWYNFAPIQRYKALSAEEAEEQFCKRDKLLNYFSLMSRKRMKKDDEGEGEEQKSHGKKKNKKDFKITDMDEWITDSEEEDGENEKGSDDDSDTQNKKKHTKDDGKKKEKASNDEAIEESDEGDFDDREVDYMSATSSNSEEEPEEEKVNREMKGVEDEEALRKFDLTDEEEETTENKETAESEEPSTEDKPTANVKTKQKKPEAASSGDSSSESSDSEFDDNKFHSAMFMQKPKKNGSDNSASSSRANTPTKMTEGKRKRKMANSSFSELAPSEKKFKHESQPGTPTMSNYSGNDGITEDSVRRYLMRKPMTTTELLQKFKSKKTGLNSDQLVTTIAQILKRLNPEKQKIKGKLYLSIKP